MVLQQTQDAINNVSTGINTIARVNNMTKEATNIANEVRAMNMPVSLQQIQNLTDEILNTNVSQAMVNQTLKAHKMAWNRQEKWRPSRRKPCKFKYRITCPSAGRPGFLTT